jgi:dTDP-4-dehydrorhamnose 3,5-epimerase
MSPDNNGVMTRKTELPGVLIVEPVQFHDSRGVFFESWNLRRYGSAGIPEKFVQDNVSRSTRGVLRGLHFQNPSAQGKLISVLVGEVYDVMVDVRLGSPTFGQWTAVTLDAESGRQLYAPGGFAHGFCVTSDSAVFTYKCTDFYAADCEYTIRWDDPQIDIRWPIENPLLSEKDRNGRCLEDLPMDCLPAYNE